MIRTRGPTPRPEWSTLLSEPAPIMHLPGSAEKVGSEVLAYYNTYRRPHFAGTERDEQQLHDNDNNNAVSRLTSFGGMKSILATSEPGLEIRLRLDKVNAETVGRLNWERLRKETMNVSWISEILSVLDKKELMSIASAEELKERQEKKGVPRSLEMHSHLKHVLDLLYEVGMYERIHKNSEMSRKVNSAVSARAVMFMVEKIGKSIEFEINGQTYSKLMLRVITDARWANVSITNNVPYQIFTLDALFQCLANMHHRANSKGRFFCINADLRHWFFQIRLPDFWRELFRFEFEDVYYRPTVLPMGWYLSPPIAQTCTWSIILTGDPPGVDKRWLSQLQSMPPWIPLVAGKGGVFVIQDNIFVVTDDEQLAEAWKQHLESQGKKYNVEFKTGQGVDVITLSRDGSETTEFNGIQIGFGGWKTADRKEREPVDQLQLSSLTHRGIHSLLGEVLWDLRVRHVKVLDCEDFMELFKVNTPASVKDWGRINESFSEVHFETLKKYVTEARKHQLAAMWPHWNSDAPLKKEEMEIFAVDASLGCQPNNNNPASARLAICRLVNAQARKNWKWSWKNDRRSHVYIGEAELEAIVWAVEEAIKANPGVRLIVIVTDSMCAKGWVERMYSDRRFANELLRYLHQLLHRESDGGERIKLTCVYAMSEHNIADVPTRDDEMESEGEFDSTLAEINGDQNVMDRLLATRKVVNAVLKLLDGQLIFSGADVIKQKRLETEMKEKNVSH